MLLKSLTLLLVIGTSLALLPPHADLKAEQGLMDFLMKSRADTGNAGLTDYCFGRYLPILKKVSDQYEIDYKRCAEDYESECSAIDGKYVHPRENITATAWESCQLLQNCSYIVNTVEVFECFAGRGSDQSKTLFNLSADAGQYAAEIRELYRAAQSISEACCNRAERTYWDDTSSTYSELSECLDGNIKPRKLE